MLNPLVGRVIAQEVVKFGVDAIQGMMIAQNSLPDYLPGLCSSISSHFFPPSWDIVTLGGSYSNETETCSLCQRPSTEI